MWDRDAKNMDVTADQLRKLPDDKLEEIAACANGNVGPCPECEAFTAFPFPPTYNSTSECHNCDYSE